MEAIQGQRTIAELAADTSLTRERSFVLGNARGKRRDQADVRVSDPWVEVGGNCLADHRMEPIDQAACFDQRGDGVSIGAELHAE